MNEEILWFVGKWEESQTLVLDTEDKKEDFTKKAT